MMVLILGCFNDSMIKVKKNFTLFFSLVAKIVTGVQVELVGMPRAFPIQFTDFIAYSNAPKALMLL